MIIQLPERKRAGNNILGFRAFRGLLLMPLKFNVAVRDWFEGGLAVGNGGVDRLFEGFK